MAVLCRSAWIPQVTRPKCRASCRPCASFARSHSRRLALLHHQLCTAPALSYSSSASLHFADEPTPLLLPRIAWTRRPAPSPHTVRGPHFRVPRASAMFSPTSAAILIWVLWGVIILPLAALRILQGRNTPKQSGSTWLAVLYFLGVLGTFGIAVCFTVAYDEFKDPTGPVVYWPGRTRYVRAPLELEMG